MKELKGKLTKMPVDIRKELNLEAKIAANNWKGLAARSAPVDRGGLGQRISVKGDKGKYEVVVNSNYAPFMEWGTKSRKKVPSDLTQYASSIQYIKTGDYYDFLNNILDWVKRKGLAGKGRGKKERHLDIAQAIANSISRHGVKPHPFFFQHGPVVQKQLNDAAKRIAERER